MKTKIEQLKELNELKKEDVLTDKEFDILKEEIISSSNDNSLNKDDAEGKLFEELGDEEIDRESLVRSEMKLRGSINGLVNNEKSDTVGDLISDLTGKMAYDKRLERLLGRNLSI